MTSSFFLFRVDPLRETPRLASARSLAGSSTRYELNRLLLRLFIELCPIVSQTIVAW